jgi:hypothetical protein
VNISPLRERFLAQQEHLPSQRIPLSSKEALTEYQVELDRVDSMLAFDGKTGDLDPKEGFVKFKHPGHSLGVPIEGWGCAWETEFGDQEKLVMSYTKVESVFMGPALFGPNINDAGQLATASPLPTFETVVEGENDRNAKSWVASRLTEGPASIRYEVVTINYADPSTSFKDVWMMNA